MRQFFSRSINEGVSLVLIASLVLAPFSFFSFFVHTSYAQTTTVLFTRDLSVGSTGDDVLLLQQILNKDPRTQVAASGAGSPGNETSYFGNLTKLAVINFQNLYASDVLTPAGLTAGTGFVGQYTRNKLNSLIASGYLNTGTSASNSSASTDSSVSPTTDTNYSIFTANGASQQAIQDYFSSINTLASAAASSTQIQTAPQTSGSVSSSTVVINSISPSTVNVSSSSTITLTGVNFSLQNNYVYSEAGYIIGATSTGTQISFTLSSFSNLNDFVTATAGDANYTLNVYIGNQFGQSNKVPLTVILPVTSNTSSSQSGSSVASSINSNINLIGGLTLVGITAALAATLALTAASIAVKPKPFAGRVVFASICTCDPSTYHIQYATPFNIPLPVNIGSLDYSPILSPINSPAGAVGGPATYMYYKPIGPPGIFDTGDYVAAVQTCFMVTPTPAGNICLPAGVGPWAWMGISYGLINRVGSSLVPLTPAAAAAAAGGSAAGTGAAGAGTTVAAGLTTDANGNTVYTTNNTNIDSDGTGPALNGESRDFPAGTVTPYGGIGPDGQYIPAGTTLTQDTTISTHQDQTAYAPGGVSLNSSTVNYVVVPPNSGYALGTQVTIVNNTTGQTATAIIGDVGPNYGEISIAAANAIGVHSGNSDSANNNNVSIIFPPH